MSKLSGVPFEALDRSQKFSWDERALWPPWFFNDIVGYLEIGWDRGRCLGGELYLRRKYFPRGARERWAGATVTQNNQFLYYGEVTREPIEAQNNVSYVRAAECIIATAEKIIRRRVTTARVWKPPWDLSCLNWVEADRQIRGQHGSSHGSVT